MGLPTPSLFARARRLTAIGVAAALVSSVITGSVVAQADTRPTDPSLPATVSTDSLPTVQIDGIVWSQVVVGNTVYAGGSFSTAQPAGAAAGTQTVPRANLLAYNLQTGALVTGFAPTLNGQVRSLAASPDGKRLYVVGEFTTVNGLTRNRVAAFDTATNTLVSGFAPSANSRVSSVAATNDTVYFGGTMTAVSRVARPGRAAAVRASTGEVLPWAPVANTDGRVTAMVLSPDNSKLVLGGNFTSLNGSSDPGYGLAAVDAVTGTTNLPWNVNKLVRNAGPDASITSLTSDGTSVYGTGYHFGPGGNLEGTFRADWGSGDLVWLEDCHGDTYSSYATPDVAYIAGHPHYCGNVDGGFPQSEPWSFYRGLAFTNAATSTLGRDPHGYYNFEGTPSPTLLHFYPTFNTGSVSGANQGPWSVTGSGDYVLYGGEFTTVNGRRQQGLARFRTAASAPNTDGPRLSGSGWEPNVVSLSTGSVRVAWPANYDRDNASLTYRVIRDGNNAAPVFETTAESTPWNQPPLGYLDTGLAPGSTHTYRIRAEDPFGNVAWSSIVPVTVSAEGTLSDYAAEVLADQPQSYWRLGEADGATAYDWASYNDATVGTGVTRGAAGAINEDRNAASGFPGNNTGLVATKTLEPGRNTFAIETWFRTTSTSGGKLVGFGNANTGNSSSYDRHVYLDGSGRVIFGVYPNVERTVSSASGFNDGAWHHVVANLGPTGMQLYVDGRRVAQRVDTTSGQAYDGYWRIGGDSSWGGTAQYFTGSIDDVAIYPQPLTGAEVNRHYTLSGRQSALPAAPTDPYGAQVYNDSPDLYWRLNEADGTVARDSSAGDSPGVYQGGVTRRQLGAVAGTTDASAQFDGSTGVVVSSRQVNDPQVYSAELWFNSTTTQGGKLIGFGSASTGTSGNYDRHVYLQPDGRLVFGTWTGSANTVTTPSAYNDGAWHHMVATMSSAGLRLYVDGALQASNSNGSAQGYAGYWRIGGDTTWGSAPYVNARIDEAAVYSTALSAEQVAQHYRLGVGENPNAAPVASFTSEISALSVSVDASDSSDPDGSIRSYTWDFGDGGSATGATASHRYTAVGTYTVRLTVTDDDGATAEMSREVSVVAPAENVAPVAAFSAEVSALSLSVDGSDSSDSDGSIQSYTWDFGDGGSATGATAVHRYAAAGTYTVRLTVTDDDGSTGTSTSTVTVAPLPPDNVAPVASFSTEVSELSVAVDASGSSDSDGSIRSYAWDFGDGGSATGATASHRYAAAGTYTVALTVTDDDGAEAVTSREVSVVAPPANVAPVASFSAEASELSVAVDGSGSSDSDGSIRSYAWDFGDGGSATGATASHRYAAAGTYTVRLTVTDDDGATTSATRTVSVATAPVARLLASDVFERSAATGLGSADVGGAWTLGSAASNYSVSGGVGRFATPSGSTRNAYLQSVSSADTEVQVTAAIAQPVTGSGAYVSVIARRTSAGEYLGRVKVLADGSTSVQVMRDGTSLQNVALTGVRFAAGERMQIRVQATGVSPTTVRAKVWPLGAAEPDAWQVSATDSTAGLQQAGHIGLRSYLSGSAGSPITFTVDGLKAGAPGSFGTAEPTPNATPVAAFSAEASELAVSVDASESSDSDGTIASYAWTFGDGGSATGVTASHRYAAAGTYPVTLTVTDDRGATATSTSTVTVAAAPVSALLVSDAFERSATNGLGSADAGGAWTLGSTASGFSVSSGLGRFATPAGSTRSAYLRDVSSTDTDARVTAVLQQPVTGSGAYVSVLARRTDAGEYLGRVKILSDGSASVQVMRDGTSLRNVTVPGLRFQAGDRMEIRVQVSGVSPTTVRAKVWAAGTAEPDAWQASATDLTAGLQQAGHVGLRSYLSGTATSAVTVAFDGLAVE